MGRLGSSDARNYTAIGDVVNLDARLKSQARAGESMVNRSVYEQVADGYIDVLPESMSLKEFKEPVVAHRLKAVIDAPEIWPVEATESKWAFRIGAAIFSILGAPCTIGTLLGALSMAIGAAGAKGSSQ